MGNNRIYVLSAPSDVILTSLYNGIGPIQSDDRLEAPIQGSATLMNTV